MIEYLLYDGNCSLSHDVYFQLGHAHSEQYCHIKDHSALYTAFHHYQFAVCIPMSTKIVPSHWFAFFFPWRKLQLYTGSVPLVFHVTSEPPPPQPHSKSDQYFVNFHASVFNDFDLNRLLTFTFQIPNIMRILYTASVVPKYLAKSEDLCIIQQNADFFMVTSCLPLAQPEAGGTTLCRLSVTRDWTHSGLPSYFLSISL